MDANDPYGNFVENAARFLAERPNSNVIIITEGPMGFETFRNSAGFGWPIGALQLAAEIIREQMDNLRSSDEEARRNAEERMKMTGLPVNKERLN